MEKGSLGTYGQQGFFPVNKIRSKKYKDDLREKKSQGETNG